MVFSKKLFGQDSEGKGILAGVIIGEVTGCTSLYHQRGSVGILKITNLYLQFELRASFLWAYVGICLQRPSP